VRALVLLLAAALADDSPRIASQPTRVCVEAQKAIFQVWNPGPVPVVVALSIEHWSAGDAEEWTTIHQDVEGKGRTAAALLKQLIENKIAGEELEAQHVVLPTHLVVRGSTGPAPSATAR